MDHKKFKKNKDVNSFKSYYGSKKEGQGFADRRKRKTAYEYLKLLKKEKERGKHEEGKEIPKHKRLSFPHAQNRSPAKGKKGHAFSVAEKIARKKQEEKEKKKQEAQRVKQEKEAAMTSYKDRKKKQYLKLCKKTSRGQPVMKFQMEVLLDKIQKKKGMKS